MKEAEVNQPAAEKVFSDEDLAALALQDSKFFTFLVTRYKERFFII